MIDSAASWSTLALSWRDPTEARAPFWHWATTWPTRICSAASPPRMSRC